MTSKVVLSVKSPKRMFCAVCKVSDLIRTNFVSPVHSTELLSRCGKRQKNLYRIHPVYIYKTA